MVFISMTYLDRVNALMDWRINHAIPAIVLKSVDKLGLVILRPCKPPLVNLWDLPERSLRLLYKLSLFPRFSTCSIVRCGQYLQLEGIFLDVVK